MRARRRLGRGLRVSLADARVWNEASTRAAAGIATSAVDVLYDALTLRLLCYQVVEHSPPKRKKNHTRICREIGERERCTCMYRYVEKLLRKGDSIHAAAQNEEQQ